MRPTAWLCAAIVLIMNTGCEQPATGGGGSTHPPGPPPVTASLTPEDVDLQIVDGAAFHAALEKNKGQVLLVDYWATWCDPCTEKFPHIVELHKKHVDEGLAVVSISTDFPEDEAAVREFLAASGATFENFLSKFGNGSQSAEELDFDGAVPLYKLFDRKGNLRYQFSAFPDQIEKGEPLENVDQRVEALLAEKSS